MKLTDEQIEKAAQALYESLYESYEYLPWAALSETIKDRYRKAARAVAPFLQVPWDEPTEEEMALAWNEYANGPRVGTWPNVLSHICPPPQRRHPAEAG